MTRRSAPGVGRLLVGVLAVLLWAVPGAAVGSSTPAPSLGATPACGPARAPASPVPSPPPSPSPALAARSPDPLGATSVSVAAAANLRVAMDELIAAYRAAHPERAVAVTYGSSGSFFAQISQGAPFDVFFSADLDYPLALEDAGLATPGSTRTYGLGRLVLWVRDASPIDLAQPGLRAVLDPAAERVAIANPELAPFGRAARSALEAVGAWAEVQPRIVLGDSISQAAQFVESGAADVGMLALSLAIAPPLCEAGRYALVPAELHLPIEQGAVVLTGAADPAAATALLEFVMGEAGRRILERSGYAPIED